MNKINIREYKIRREIPPKLSANQRCAIDTEFVGMDDKKLHRPTGEFACATFYFGTEEVYIVENVSDLQQAFDNIMDAGWIFHNAKFDIFHLRRYTHIPVRMMLWDTQLVEQVMYSGKFTEFNLAACLRRHCNIYMEKETREEFSGWSGEMTQSQIEYACVDVIGTFMLFVDQRTNIDADDLNVWKTIELPFLWCLLSIGGIKFDSNRWLQIAEENTIKAQEIQDKYGKKIPRIGKSGKELKTLDFDGINLSSPKQVKEHLQKLKFNLESTDEEHLATIADECEFAKDLLKYRTLAKRSGTYGKEYLEKYVESDGRIYTDYFQMGAISSRLSSRSPNLQNQPREGGYRECYVADENKVLVIADSTAQEPKFAAYLSGDANLIDALNSNEKLYVRIARDSLGITVKKGEEAYNHMKSTILGLIYGMSPKGLAKQIHKTEDEARDLINALFNAYPDLHRWIRESQSKFRDYVITVSGRKVWLNPYTSAWRRLILNAPIQGSAAEAFKLAVITLVNEWHGGLDVPLSCLRLFVHDEICCEIDKNDLDNFLPVIECAMLSSAESLHKGIKAGVEIGFGENWAAKK